MFVVGTFGLHSVSNLVFFLRIHSHTLYFTTKHPTVLYCSHVKLHKSTDSTMNVYENMEMRPRGDIVSSVLIPLGWPP